jgi:hypothetical protein
MIINAQLKIQESCSDAEIFFRTVFLDKVRNAPAHPHPRRDKEIIMYAK